MILPRRSVSDLPFSLKKSWELVCLRTARCVLQTLPRRQSQNPSSEKGPGPNLGGHFGPEKKYLAPPPPHKHCPGALPSPAPQPRKPPPLPLFFLKAAPPGHLLERLFPFPRRRTEKNQKAACRLQIGLKACLLSGAAKTSTVRKDNQNLFIQLRVSTSWLFCFHGGALANLIGSPRKDEQMMFQIQTFASCLF